MEDILEYFKNMKDWSGYAQIKDGFIKQLTNEEYEQIKENNPELIGLSLQNKELVMEYFVSFYYEKEGNQGWGNMVVKINREIQTGNDVVELQNKIKESEQCDFVCIIGYQRIGK